MTLYEIKSELMECVDFETGEITNFEKFENLQIAKEKFDKMSYNDRLKLYNENKELYENLQKEG